MRTEYTLTATESAKATLSLEQITADVERLTLELSSHSVGEKVGEAIIPAVFEPCPEQCRRSKQVKHDGRGIDCGGGQQHRLSSNVTHVTMLGVDLDHLSSAVLDSTLQRLRETGLRFWWWNTHSHNPPNDARARLLIPFAEPFEVKRISDWSKVAWPELIKALGLEGAAAADESCKDPCRVYYLPRKPAVESPHQAGFEPGTRELDWREFVKPEAFTKPLTPRELPKADPNAPVDLDRIRARLKAIKSDSKVLWARVLNGEAPTPPPELRPPGEPSRYYAWRTLTSSIASVADEHEPDDALLTILEPAWLTECAESPEDHTDWETIESLLSQARARADEWKADREATRAKARETMLNTLARIKVRSDGQVAHVEPLTEEQAEAQAEGEWKRELDLDENERPKSGVHNVQVMLRTDPQWAGTLRLNTLLKTVEIFGGPLLTAGEKPGREIRDSDAIHASAWFALHTGIKIPENRLWGVLVAVAEENPYNPVTDYLDACEAAWDGESRTPDWLVHYLGAVDPGGDYLAAVGVRWLVGAVMRAYEPGCKFDTMLTIEGAQGVGKSTAFQILGGKWFTDAAISMADQKGATEIISENWIVEIAEMQGLRKSEVATQRAFLSRTFDDCRPSYGRKRVRYPRCCVLVGTSNTDDYLTDEAGNRRHWPVAVTKIDIEALRRDRDQLWGEAVALYRSGEVRPYLDGAEIEQQIEQAAMRTASDPVAEGISNWLLKMAPDKRPTTVSVRQILVDVLEQPDLTRGSAQKVAAALRRLGFTTGALVGAERMRTYNTPAALLESPQLSGLLARRLHVVPHPPPMPKPKTEG